MRQLAAPRHYSRADSLTFFLKESAGSRTVKSFTRVAFPLPAYIQAVAPSSDSLKNEVNGVHRLARPVPVDYLPCMAADFRTLLLDRLEEIERQLPAARAVVVRLENERADIIKAADATGITLFSKEDRGDNSESNNAPTSKSERHAHYTMKDAAVQILEGLPDGLTANQIKEVMRENFGLDYERSSLSPQLSRLKADGLVTSVGGRWMLSKYQSGGASTSFVRRI